MVRKREFFDGCANGFYIGKRRLRIVETYIDVRIRPRGPARVRTSQNDRFNSRYLRELKGHSAGELEQRGEGVQELQEFRSCRIGESRRVDQALVKKEFRSCRIEE
jgi:hypothetical protein